MRLSHSSVSLKSIDACGVITIIVCTLIAYVLIAQPILTRRSAQARQNDELTTLRVSSEDHRLAREQTAAAVERLQAELARCEVIPVSVNSLNARMMSLGELAAASGLTVETIRGEDARPVSKRLLVPIKIIARGSCSSLSAFLSELSVKFRDTAVEKFDFAAERSENGRDTALAHVDLAWYAVSDAASDVAAAGTP